MRWQTWVAFAALCVWAASGWLLSPTSNALPGLERQALGFAAIAAVTTALGGLRMPQERWRRWGAVAAGSTLFFAIPTILLETAKEYSPETSVSLIFALAPVVTVLVWNAFVQPSAMRQLVPALMGVAGLLLLLPFEMPVSARSWSALAEVFVAMVLVAASGVWLHKRLRDVHAMEALAVAGVSNAVVLLTWCAVHGMLDWRWRDIAAGVAWQGAVSAALVAVEVWLLREIPPVGFSVRFLLIPLVTILEGAVLLRPEITGRILVGFLLLTGGAVWVLAGRGQVDEEVLTLR